MAMITMRNLNVDRIVDKENINEISRLKKTGYVVVDNTATTNSIQNVENEVKTKSKATK